MPAGPAPTISTRPGCPAMMVSPWRRLLGPLTPRFGRLDQKRQGRTRCCRQAAGLGQARPRLNLAADAMQPPGAELIVQHPPLPQPTLRHTPAPTPAGQAPTHEFGGPPPDRIAAQAA